jgi:hypothetical protein
MGVKLFSLTHTNSKIYYEPFRTSLTCLTTSCIISCGTSTTLIYIYIYIPSYIPQTGSAWRGSGGESFCSISGMFPKWSPTVWGRRGERGGEGRGNRRVRVGGSGVGDREGMKMARQFWWHGQRHSFAYGSRTHNYFNGNYCIRWPNNVHGCSMDIHLHCLCYHMVSKRDLMFSFWFNQNENIRSLFLIICMFVCSVV